MARSAVRPPQPPSQHRVDLYREALHSKEAWPRTGVRTAMYKELKLFFEVAFRSSHKSFSAEPPPILLEVGIM